MLKKIRSGFIVVLGFLLSPLCWWNDLLFNLPIAYGFGLIFRWFSNDLFLTGAIIGYWLSNIVGILLIQWGTVEFVGQQVPDSKMKKDLIVGLGLSTAFTVVMAVLIQSNIVDIPFISALATPQNHPLSLN